MKNYLLATVSYEFLLQEGYEFVPKHVDGTYEDTKFPIPTV